MNRRTFIKSALVFILGMLGLRFLPQQNKVESIALDRTRGESHTRHIWATMGNGKVYVTDISNDDGLPTGIWKQVAKDGDL